MQYECWMPIPGYKEIYLVSDLGRVMRIKNSNNTRPGKILSPGLNTQGYEFVGLSRSGKVKLRTVHSLVMEAFVGPRPPDYHINHRDGNPLNNRLVNLEYVTAAENIMHLSTLPRQNRFVLTPCRVLVLRRCYYEKGMSIAQIAKRFGMKQDTARLAIKRETWSRVDDPYGPYE